MDRDDRAMRLLEGYAAARARGEEPDVGALLDAAGDDAPRLAGLLEGYLASAPPDPEPAPEAVAMFQAILDDEPPLLALRHARALTLDAVADSLVARLGLAAVARDRVRALYQSLECGLLDISDAAARLRTALAEVLGVDADRLVAVRHTPPDAVFARAHGGWERALGGLPDEPLPGPELPEVDGLFGRREGADGAGA